MFYIGIAGSGISAFFGTIATGILGGGATVADSKLVASIAGGAIGYIVVAIGRATLGGAIGTAILSSGAGKPINAVAVITTDTVNLIVVAGGASTFGSAVATGVLGLGIAAVVVQLPAGTASSAMLYIAIARRHALFGSTVGAGILVAIGIAGVRSAVKGKAAIATGAVFYIGIATGGIATLFGTVTTGILNGYTTVTVEFIATITTDAVGGVIGLRAAIAFGGTIATGIAIGLTALIV